MLDCMVLMPLNCNNDTLDNDSIDFLDNICNVMNRNLLYYIYVNNVVKQFTDHVLQEAVKWFSRQHYVDDTRVGAIGLCFGGTLCLYVASLSPLVVNLYMFVYTLIFVIISFIYVEEEYHNRPYLISKIITYHVPF